VVAERFTPRIVVATMSGAGSELWIKLQERRAMIKVITGYKLKSGADILPILLKLRSQALTYSGFVGAENLVNDKDSSIVAIISTWDKVEDWRSWEASRARREILREAEAILEEELRVTIYRIIPTARWV
jgi:heme-degrading monooxygenase HmoA